MPNPRARISRSNTSWMVRVPGHRTAFFADGTSATGDVLVGADGIHSRTRRLIDPEAPGPRYSGQHVVYGYTPGNPAGLDPDEYHMVHGSRAFFGLTVPAGDGRTWWFARVRGAEPAAGQEAQRDLGQAHDGLRSGDTGATSKRDFQPPA